VCHASEAGTLENSDDLVFGNHETSKGIQENSINYASSEEVYDNSTTIANLYFSTVIVENFLSDPYLKTIAECKNRLDWNKWKNLSDHILPRIATRAPSDWYSHIPICLCPESIEKVQYGQSTST
jgi:hypothetical protein